MKTNDVILIGDRHIDAIYPKGIKCFSFIRMLYAEAGLSLDFNLQPIISSINDLENRNNVGKIIFLKRKNLDSDCLFSHLAIIYDDKSVIHYSRHMKNNGNRQVLISSFEELLRIYYLIPNPYVLGKNKKETYKPYRSCL